MRGFHGFIMIIAISAMAFIAHFNAPFGSDSAKAVTAYELSLESAVLEVAAITAIYLAEQLPFENAHTDEAFDFVVNLALSAPVTDLVTQAIDSVHDDDLVLCDNIEDIKPNLTAPSDAFTYAEKPYGINLNTLVTDLAYVPASNQVDIQLRQVMNIYEPVYEKGLADSFSDGLSYRA